MFLEVTGVFASGGRLPIVEIGQWVLQVVCALAHARQIFFLAVPVPAQSLLVYSLETAQY
jgi:hypothetical protein